MNFDYERQWQVVSDYEQKSLPASALKEVEKIYLQAKSSQNTEQQIKALIHQLKFIDAIEEDAFEKNIEKVKTEIITAKFPTKQILHSMLAEMYWQYYTQHRWEFAQRSATINFVLEDIKTWSIDRIIEQTHRHYQLSLTEPEMIKAIKMNQIQKILTPSNELGSILRPTLYDLMIHRALDFYRNEESNLSKPIYAFELKDELYFSDNKKFSSIRIVAQDTSSMKYNALKLLQKLTVFHLEDQDPSALLEVTLIRLKFIYNNFTNTNKKSLYLNALEQLAKDYYQHPSYTNIAYELAQYYQAQGALYNPLVSEEYRYDLKKSLDIINEAIDRFPKSHGAYLCSQLKSQLLSKDLHAVLEQVNIPNQPFLMRLSYKNVRQVSWKVIKTSKEEIWREKKKWKTNSKFTLDQMLMNYYQAMPAVQNFSTSLPASEDLHLHSTELKIDSLPEGFYFILISDDIGEKSKSLAFAFTQVSNLSYIQRNTKNGATEFYVLNRKSGKPISGAIAKVYRHEYNSSKNEYEREQLYTNKTNIDGSISVPFQNNSLGRGNLSVEFEYQNDLLSSESLEDIYNSGSIYQYIQNEAATPEVRCLFFLDRAIYRPGQTIYFKALLFSSNGKHPAIIAKRSFEVSLFDVNHQKISTQKFISNDFGTVQGSFKAPSSGLTGQMHLAAENYGTAYFSVEEYKRPKFEVLFEPIKNDFRIGENIVAIGKAKAYSGAKIDGAKVKYRVVRNTRFPDWWCFWRGYYPSSPEVEINNGVSLTDVEGNFKIPFFALPDLSIDKSSEPVFSFTIYADVTDLNGETHSQSVDIQIGYKSIELSIPVRDIDKQKTKTKNEILEIEVRNLSGEYRPAKGVVKIYKLKAPEKAYKAKLWEYCDQQVINPIDYQRDFPEEAYQDITKPNKWAKEKEVFTLEFDTEKQKNFTLKDLQKWSNGQYLIEALSKDIYGQEVQFKDYFMVFDSKSNKLAKPEINFIHELKTKCEPSDTASLLFGASAPKINVLYEIEHDGKIIHKNWLELQSEQKILEIPIKEEYRGNIIVYTSFVLESRFYHNTSVITVPFSNKELDISFETFRNKLQPGEKEQWKIKVKGKTVDKFKAEMVASLYDASLDEFRVHNWFANFYNSFYATLNWSSGNGFGLKYFIKPNYNWGELQPFPFIDAPRYRSLNWFGCTFGQYDMYLYSGNFLTKQSGKPGMVKAGIRIRGASSQNMPNDAESSMDEIAATGYGATTNSKTEETVKKSASAQRSESKPSKTPNIDTSTMSIRKNFNETAFFYPNLYTNEQGEIIVQFTIPEALTRWKMLGFAHTKDLKFGTISMELITQKELMIVPNAPRFLRENDELAFSAKISNLSNQPLKGLAQLEFFDALTMKPINVMLQHTLLEQSFTIDSAKSTSLNWKIKIPEGLQAITYRIVAKAGNFSDGEEMTLPVVTNRMLITETMPMAIRGNQTKKFSFNQLKNSTSTTLKNYKYTLEFTQNPIWNAIMALPYMMEYPYECVEQTFSRYYANAIAYWIVNSNPEIKSTFEIWSKMQPSALLSNLEKNQELKSALLEEMPWLLDAKDENERKSRIALLFDVNRMNNEQSSYLERIIKAQNPDGGLSWFPGMISNRYITQYILCGMGHLEKIGAITSANNSEITQFISKALIYLDNELKQEYMRLKRDAEKGRIKLSDNHLGYHSIQYLYTRSFYPDVHIEKSFKEAHNFYLNQAKNYWTKSGNIYLQGMICLALYRNNDKATPHEMIKSFKERALKNEEMGMYWKTQNGYYWYNAPIETQALMIEVFDEVANDTASVEEMKIWLLKQKQTQDWKTTKATAAACYALLKNGINTLSNQTPIEITIGNENLTTKEIEDMKPEAGTGYFKKSWDASEIKPNMAEVSVVKKDAGIAWGAVYWQYFENLDKVASSATPLALNKKLFLEVATDKGPVLTPVNNETVLKLGDLIKVRIELRVDRNMEYIHLKDMRAAALEPINTLSSYKYQNNLGYYESTRDLATNFFIDYLPKGTYVFEYPLRVSQKGDFSNGITTIQCMYAPEFSSHSEGIRIKIK